MGPILSLQQEVGHFDVWWHFSQIHAYFENYLVLELTHHSLHTRSVSSSCLEDEKLWKSFGYVIPGGHDGGNHLFPSREASSLYNFYIQFPIYTKMQIYVDGVAPSTSQHQY